MLLSSFRRLRIRTHLLVSMRGKSKRGSGDSIIKKLLIANRGEIAIRIARTAAEMDIRTIGVCAADDIASLHSRKCDECVVLKGSGSVAYLDAAQIIEIAKEKGCDAIHPGYGFLSENVEFATMCEASNIKFVGPTSKQLSLFGDKNRARELAAFCGVPTIAGTGGSTTLEEAVSFYHSLPPGSKMLIKATAGGGGRGMRIVNSLQSLPELLSSCKKEARAFFGDDSVYVERLIPRARHIEVQVVGDGKQVGHLFERECTIQRKHQKLIEIAPAPHLDKQTREALYSDALKMASTANYVSLGTFEFLVDCDDPNNYYFIETNPRIQVEHTVTEAITSLDLVEMQLLIAGGVPLDGVLGDRWNRTATGFAIQARVNMETVSKGSDDSAMFVPTGGATIGVFEPPSGLGIRVDSFVYAGYQTSTMYDSLLAKVVVHSKANDYISCLRKLHRTMKEFRIEGQRTNIPFLMKLLNSADIQRHVIHTRYVDENLKEFLPNDETTQSERSLFFSTNDLLETNGVDRAHISSKQDGSSTFIALNGSVPVVAPMQGTIISVSVNEGSEVIKGQQVAIIEAMKMEHVVQASAHAKITRIFCNVNDTVQVGQVLFLLEPKSLSADSVTAIDNICLDYIRPDLAEAISRHQKGYDEFRQAIVSKRHANGRRTARENLYDLCDKESFIEYGGLAIAAQRQRRSFEDLVLNTPGDGMVCGIGDVNRDIFPANETKCLIMSYDYTVLAGTQGLQNHRKKDRMFEIAEKLKIPVILFAEGGGGRPGDTDTSSIAGLDCMAFSLYAKLSGLVPRIGIASGRCFAGNAALLGASDVVIATMDSNIGMGGPAMIEGGGLGVFRPEEIGPIDVQSRNGVVDIVAINDEEAVLTAKKYLSYFQGSLKDWKEHDQRLLRSVVPENRLRVYDVREAIRILADVDSVLELRSTFCPGMITSLARIEGRPIGIIANNPLHLSGAIDSNCADKASRFMQLCDAFSIPILSLCDTPGIMVGPEIEKTALVRHAARLFVTAASITVPILTIVLRKGYGLGAMAMAGGSFKSSIFTIAWPSGEFGGMGLEGSVKLGFRKELDSIKDPEQRKREYERRIKELYDQGKAVNYATAFEIDTVVDPSHSRLWLSAVLTSIPEVYAREKKRPCIDTW